MRVYEIKSPAGYSAKPSEIYIVIAATLDQALKVFRTRMGESDPFPVTSVREIGEVFAMASD